ncbi:hypothetical protein [Hyalangium sp.]|uniref:hypothetical protein n=1 Tax=Hyalangium sp. TaxID=2028555 RepID=UPI002D30E2F5|nr:hypothetical protein [Hyalangium sp.]HYI01110.1 hypothetical protein [Hyalangium sp.]
MRVVLLLLCLLSGTAALAQVPPAEESPPASPQPPALHLEPGQPLRVSHGGLLLEGRLLDVDERSLTLVGPDQTQRELVPLTAVQELSVRRRSPGYGALVGAGVGFLTGAFTGGFLCGITDYPSQSSCLGLAGVVGALFGVSGAGLGALVGLLVPHWELVYERHPSADKSWQLGLLFSSIFGLTSPLSTLNPGVRAEALFQFGRHFAMGPELAFHYLIQSLYRFPVNKPLISFGVLMRVMPSSGVLAPSLLAGFGLHPADTVRPGRYSLGVGLDRQLSSGRPLALELRWHHSGLPWEGKDWLITLDVGTRFFR